MSLHASGVNIKCIPVFFFHGKGDLMHSICQCRALKVIGKCLKLTRQYKTVFYYDEKMVNGYVIVIIFIIHIYCETGEQVF